MPASDAPLPAQEPAPAPVEENGTEPAPSPASTLLRSFRTFLWPVVCLFQFGLLVGGFWIGHRSGPSVEMSPTAIPPPESTRPAGPTRPEPSTALPPAAPRGELGRADDLLRQGRYELALAVYQPLKEGATAALGDQVQYRVALCLEGLGRWDQALAEFRAIASRSPAPAVAAAAQIGQARAWIRLRRPAEAKALLSDLLLRSAEPALRQQPFLADARYLLAVALTVEVLRPVKPGPLTETVVAHSTTGWPVERALDWAAGPKDGKAASLELDDSQLVVLRLGPGPEGYQVRRGLGQVSVASLLERLAEQSGLQAHWTPQARQRIAERTTVVVVDSLPLADVLRALTDPLGLVWGIDGGAASFSAEQEAAPEWLAAYRVALARRALRDAVLAYPGHPLTPAAYLELGNLEVADGKLTEALAWYGRLIRELPRSALVTEAYYNLGLTQRRLRDSAAARSSFYRVVDRAPGPRTHSLAYFRIGHLHLEEGEAELALPPLRRATAAAAGTLTEPAAALALAAAYLLTDNPPAHAHAVLLENRQVIHSEPYRPAAAFLDALARYRASPDRRQAQREAGSLLASLFDAQGDTVLGPAGKLLLGQAFRELGLSEQMEVFYERALRDLHGPLAAEMTYLWAEALYTADRREAARQRFASLAAQEKSNWAARAHWRLAEITLQENRPSDCLTWCRKLLREASAADVTRLLQLMGKAYEQLGDHERAARCYLGQVPE